MCKTPKLSAIWDGVRNQHCRVRLRWPSFPSFMVLTTLFCLSGANPAVTQSASFAFGAGGFVEDTSNEVGLFNECKAQLDANGKAVCDAYTTLVDGQGETVNIAQTMLSSEYGDLQASSNSGAVAAFDLSGFGSTATRCALSQSNGFSHCHSGASASSDGAFAATKLGSMR